MAKTYNSYKDSGVEWIGEIPEGWEVLALKRIFKIIAGATPKSENEAYWDGDIAWITPADYKTEQKYVSFGRRNLSEQGYHACSTVLLPKGSIVFSKRAPIGLVAITERELCTNQGCLGCVPIRDVSNVFMYYLLSVYTEQFELYGSGTTFKEISANNFANFKLMLPPLSEQQSIASFLDTKCGEIDYLISLQEEMISELQAYKQSVITEAVTKGLDPNAKMKDSGVEWIGEIPENWKVSKVGLQYNVILGKMLCPKQLNDDYTLEKYYCAANVHFNGIEGELKKMWFSSLDKETYLTKKGDLLVVEGGAGAGGCAIVNDDESPVYIQNSIMIVRPKLINDVRYLRYQIEQFVKRGYIDVVCNKATIPHFTKDKVSNMQIPLPSFEVQQQIANYLDDKTSQIDSLISLKQQKIDELKSYKKSIIYEYVTGKKRV